MVLRNVATVLYVMLAAGGLLWIRLRTGGWWPGSLPGPEPGRSLLLGAGAAVTVVVGTAMITARVPWFRWLALEIRRIIGRPDTRTCAHLAILSGVAEELLFRGAMQPALGYVATSLLFGVLHTGPNRRYVAWMVFAVVVGFGLGGIYELTGSLLGPILAHVAINFLNLRRLAALELDDAPVEPVPGPEEDKVP